MLPKTENERQFRIFFTCASIVWTNLKPIWDVSYIRIWGKCRDVFNVFFYDHIDHNIDQVDCYPNHLSILTGTHEYVSSSGVGATKDFVFESSNLSIEVYSQLDDKKQTMMVYLISPPPRSPTRPGEDYVAVCFPRVSSCLSL